jgi:DNA-binding LytR/AlgR family response regulator
MQQQYKSRFMVKMGDGISTIKTEDVNHFVSEDGVVLLSTNQMKRFALDQTLDELLQQLDPSVFFKINRKVIVNINAIQKVNSYFNSRLKINIPGLTDDDCIVSRERVADFKLWLGA